MDKRDTNDVESQLTETVSQRIETSEYNAALCRINIVSNDNWHTEAQLEVFM